MGTALSQDIRDRFAALYAEGHTAREIGRRLMISAATAVRFAAKLHKGKDLIPLPNWRNKTPTSPCGNYKLLFWMPTGSRP